MRQPKPEELEIVKLGPCRRPSPLQSRGEPFVPDDRRVLATADPQLLSTYSDSGMAAPAFEVAGPRERIFFDPEKTTCGIVTCGGICPGLNDVIRALVMSLVYSYGVRRILGFCYGYAGLSLDSRCAPLELTPDVVEPIHAHGGTILGSSRGPQDVGGMLETLQRHGVGILFTIGGDGTLRGAAALGREAQRRRLPLAVIGIPKTIDNDLEWTQRSFGFSTAVEMATKAIDAAHTEARGAWNGVGLVKLMGRHSGFIAAHACLAHPDANFCLVPEVPFRLQGDEGFLALLEQRLAEKQHAVIVVAEGAAQELLQDPEHAERDASGNVRLQDVGIFLRDEIRRHFGERNTPVDVKYIDPSYIIRSLPANAIDAEYCLVLAQSAAHAGFSGRTNMVVGFWNRHFTHIPIGLVVGERKQLDPRGATWRAVLRSTGQPESMGAGTGAG
ncbi:MAG: ATP-dependent 6-phosphofructokinase [Candidatus Latescibacterota bacterium]|nr:MAG: ATP-dependent 6-phosphofructokinase [Candidatus Latescibacterota bacterium]